MFLVIDCGNTNTVFAVYSFKNNELFLENSWRLDTSEKRTPDDYFIWLNQVLSISKIDLKNISGVSIASVVPEVLLNIKLMLKTYLNVKTLIIGEDIVDLKIKINIENPKEAGSDRLVNACAVKFLKFDTAHSYRFWYSNQLLM
jgi:pantothenate kinase, type III